MSASLYVSASVPLFLIHEYYPSITPKDLIRKSWEVDKDGYASLPTGIGLGCEVNWISHGPSFAIAAKCARAKAGANREVRLPEETMRIPKM